MILLLFSLFALFLIIGIPIAVAVALVPLFFILFVFERFSPAIVPFEMYKMLDSFPFLSIPLFILAGNLMNKIKVTEQLIRLSNSIVGHIRGGLANINIVVSMLFAGLNGSAVADAVSVGAILIPAMEDEGYESGFSGAVTAASSTIGAIIPPSVGMIIYGATLGVSIGGMFAAGIIPGILIGLSLIAVATVASIIKKYPVHSKGFSWINFLVSLKESILALFLPLIILGGIVFGVFTATEAAAIAVLYAVILGFVVYRNLTFRSLVDSMYESAFLSGVILLLIGTSAPFSWLINIMDIPDAVTEIMLGITSNKYVLLGIMLVFMLIMGMVMDATANILIFGPILSPLAVDAGIDPIHFALLMVMALIIGVGTPPVGSCLFAVVPLGKATLEEVSVAIVPFFFAQTFILFLCAYMPFIVMWIPKMLGFTGGP